MNVLLRRSTFNYPERMVVTAYAHDHDADAGSQPQGVFPIPRLAEARRLVDHPSSLV